jgi:electron transfer flavoprotein beta subunit
VRIFVAVKCVPDTAAKVRIGAGGKTIDPAGVKFIMSPYDEMGLEEALRIKERLGNVEVVAVTVGGDNAQTMLRSALAMGADSALHLAAEAPTGLELDGLQTASILAVALAERPFALLAFGRLAVDDQSSQVGTLTARLLGIPSVAEVTKVELAGGKARFHHNVHGAIEVVECSLPAAFTAQKGLAEPRYPSMKAIMASKKKPVESVAVKVPEPYLEALALELPPARKPGKIVGEGREGVKELVRLLREEAKVI